MRLLVATGIFHPESGGPATYLFQLLPEIVRRGHDVTLLSFGDSPPADYGYPVSRISRQSTSLKRYLLYYRTAERLWPGHDLAFVHSIGLPLPRQIRPRVIKVVGDKAWERSINRAWIRPDTDIDVFQTSRYGPLVSLSKLLQKRSIRRCDQVIVPSHYLKNMVAGWGVDPERIRVIYNALLPREQTAATTREQARASLKLPQKPLLLAAARLVPWKGIDLILEALANLDTVHLIIAGDGPESESILARIEDKGLQERVTLVGQIPRKTMPLYFQAADYTILYSGYEGLSHLLLESLRYGTPVIASEKGGNPEVVEHQRNGLLVPYPDPQALAQAIKLAFEPGMRDKLAREAHLGMERFEWERLVNHTIHILENAIRISGRD